MKIPEASDPHAELRHDDGAPDAYAIVEEFWSYDGPHDERKTGAAALLLARLVRYMNNATQPGYSGITSAPALGRVVGNLDATVYALDQLLDQLAHHADRLADDPTLYDDQRPREHGGGTAGELSAALLATRSALQAVRYPLDHANALGSRLGHRSEGEA